MEQVLITGASGRLGRETVRQLVAHGYGVVAIDRVQPHEAHPIGVRTVQIDLLDVGQIAGAMQGCGAVIHLGAIPNPYDHADEVVFHNNTGATFAVLQAASLLGIKRLALASSGSIYGTAWSPTHLPFTYAPVDERHPLMVNDVYALSKETDERTAEMFCRRDGMSIAALRFHWIGTREEQLEKVAFARTQDDHTYAVKDLWGYVDIRDAARACLLAIEAVQDRPFGFVPMQIVAADTLSDHPTEEMIRRWSRETEIRKHLPGTSSAYETDVARRVIGWTAIHSWRDGMD